MNDLVWRVDEVSAPNALTVLGVDEVRDDVLLLPEGSPVETYVARIIRAAAQDAQLYTGLAIGTQTLKYVADRFPSDAEWLELPYPPVTAITAVEYVDEAGDLVPWSASPQPWEESLPTGPNPRRARIRPLSGTSWPTTQAQRMDAVQVTFTAGFTAQNVPASVVQGMFLVIGELFKQRSESVHALNQSPAVIRARNLWSRLKKY